MRTKSEGGYGADSSDQQAGSGCSSAAAAARLSRSRLGSAGSAASLLFPSQPGSTATAGGARGPPRPIRAAGPWAPLGRRKGGRAPPTATRSHTRPRRSGEEEGPGPSASRALWGGCFLGRRRARGRASESVSSSSSSLGGAWPPTRPACDPASGESPTAARVERETCVSLPPAVTRRSRAKSRQLFAPAPLSPCAQKRGEVN